MAVRRTIKKKTGLRTQKPAQRKSVAQKRSVKHRTARASAKKYSIGIAKKSAHIAGAQKTIKSPYGKKDLAKFQEILLSLRDRVIDEIGFLVGDNIARSQRESSGDLSSYSFHAADQGTDNFDQEFALNLASNEQDILYEIDEALGRIESNTFGVCEVCGCKIERARLEAIPYTRMCVKCKTQSEKGKVRYRPFGETMSRTILSSE